MTTKSPSNILIDSLDSNAVTVETTKILIGSENANGGFVYHGNPLPVNEMPSQNLSVHLPRNIFLTEAGDGTGNYNANGDYSTTAKEFFYSPPADHYLDVETITICISDATKFYQGSYGGIASGLTNGATIWAVVGATYIPLLSGLNFKYNYQWFMVTPYVQLTSFEGTAQTLQIIFKFKEQFGTKFSIGPGGKLVVRYNDNLTGLIENAVSIQGIRYPD